MVARFHVGPTHHRLPARHGRVFLQRLDRLLLGVCLPLIGRWLADHENRRCLAIAGCRVGQKQLMADSCRCVGHFCGNTAGEPAHLRQVVQLPESADAAAHSRHDLGLVCGHSAQLVQIAHTLCAGQPIWGRRSFCMQRGCLLALVLRFGLQPVPVAGD